MTTRISPVPAIQSMLNEQDENFLRQKVLVEQLRAAWEDGPKVRPIIVELDGLIMRSAELINAEIEVSKELEIELDPERLEQGLRCMASAQVLHQVHESMLRSIDEGSWPAKR